MTSPENATRLRPEESGSLHAGGSEVLQPVFGFKPSHFTRGKDGAPSPIIAPLSADADRGDQESLVLPPLLGGGRSQGAGDAADNTPVVAQPWPAVAPTLDARDAKGPGNFHNGELQATVIQDRPRRLMPIETERLMGWPDDHTAEGIDEQGRPYRLKDTPRYRLCGNGVGAPQAEWIGRRMVETISALAGAGRAA